jgi:CheY-like chemotaxis protein
MTKQFKLFNKTNQIIYSKEYFYNEKVLFSSFLNEFLEQGLRLKDIDLSLSISTINHENHLSIKKILYVEDDTILSSVIKKFGEKAGHYINCVGSAEEALTLIQKYPNLFDIVLLDKHLPGLDGDEFGKKLKVYNHDVKIFLVTGDTSSLPSNILNLGFESIISKPFTFERFTNAVGVADHGHNHIKKVA